MISIASDDSIFAIWSVDQSPTIKQRLRRAMVDVGNKPTCSITLEDLKNYRLELERLMAAGRLVTYTRARFDTLCLYLTWAYNQNLLPENLPLAIEPIGLKRSSSQKSEISPDAKIIHVAAAYDGAVQDCKLASTWVLEGSIFVSVVRRKAIAVAYFVNPINLLLYTDEDLLHLKGFLASNEVRFQSCEIVDTQSVLSCLGSFFRYASLEGYSISIDLDR